jgi:hypothetical protein
MKPINQNHNRIIKMDLTQSANFDMIFTKYTNHLQILNKIDIHIAEETNIDPKNVVKLSTLLTTILDMTLTRIMSLSESINKDQINLIKAILPSYMDKGDFDIQMILKQKLEFFSGNYDEDNKKLKDLLCHYYYNGYLAKIDILKEIHDDFSEVFFSDINFNTLAKLPAMYIQFFGIIICQINNNSGVLSHLFCEWIITILDIELEEMGYKITENYPDIINEENTSTVMSNILNTYKSSETNKKTPPKTAKKPLENEDMWIKDMNVTITPADNDGDFSIILNATIDNSNGKSPLDKLILKTVLIDNNDNIVYVEDDDIDIYLDALETQDISLKSDIWTNSKVQRSNLSRIYYYIDIYTAISESLNLRPDGKSCGNINFPHENEGLDIKNITILIDDEPDDDGDVRVNLRLIAQNSTKMNSLLKYTFEIKDRRNNVLHDFNGDMTIADDSLNYLDEYCYIKHNMLKNISYSANFNSYFRIHNAVINVDITTVVT